MGRMEDIKTTPRAKPKKEKTPAAEGKLAPFTGDYIDEALKAKSGFTAGSKSNVVYASSIGNGARLLLIRYKGIYQDRVEYGNVKYMEQGTATHDLWEKRLQKSGLLLAAEINVPNHPDFDLRGRLDFLVRGPEGLDEPVLIEFKTTGNKKFSSLSVPEPDHMAQWATYAERKGLSYGLIVYENRDSLADKFFPIIRNGPDISAYSFNGRHVRDFPGFIDHLYDKVRFVVWCASVGKFPEKKCPECVQWGCKQPRICMEMEMNQELVTIEKWKEMRRKKNGEEIPDRIGLGQENSLLARGLDGPDAFGDSGEAGMVGGDRGAASDH